MKDVRADLVNHGKGVSNDELSPSSTVAAD